MSESRTKIANFVKKAEAGYLKKRATLIRTLLESSEKWERSVPKELLEKDIDEENMDEILRFLIAKTGFFLSEAEKAYRRFSALVKSLQGFEETVLKKEDEKADSPPEREKSETKERDADYPVEFTDDGGVIVSTPTGKRFYEASISKVTPAIKGMASMIGSVEMEDGEYIPGSVHGAEKIVRADEDREKVARFYAMYAKKAFGEKE